MDDSNEPIASICSLELDLPPSCVEFCPMFPSYFLVGTYYLQKEEAPALVEITDADNSNSQGVPSSNPQKRNGSIVVYEVVDNTMYVSRLESLFASSTTSHMSVSTCRRNFNLQPF